MTFRSGGVQAVLWDMDGTLVDTEPYWIASEFEIVERYGNGSWSHEHGLALVGKDLRDSAAYISDVGEVPFAVDEIVNLMMDGVIARCAEATPWRPGARELLAELGELGVPCALVTMSWRRLTDAILPLLPTDSFAAVVTGDDVERGKPFPDPYLVAAAHLGLEARHCVAIEDSVLGARSADAAGCCTVVVPHAVPVPPELGHHRLTSLDGVCADDLSGLFSSCPMPHAGA